jgi:hypothetical protein
MVTMIRAIVSTMASTYSLIPLAVAKTSRQTRSWWASLAKHLPRYGVWFEIETPTEVFLALSWNCERPGGD